MPMTYTWKVKNLKTTNVPGTNLNNVVVATRWTITGTDEDGNSATYEGATPFRFEEVDQNNFIDFNNLTEETVLSWIQEVVIGDYLKRPQEEIQKQINKFKNPVSDVHYFPWAPTVPVTEEAELEVRSKSINSTNVFPDSGK